MKKFLFLIVAVLSMASCKSLPEKVEDFVSDVEAEYKTYTDLDWLEKDQKCAELKLEYAKKADKLSQYERDYINKAFGRYDAVVAKAKIDDTVSGVKKFIKDAGQYIEGVVEGISSKDTVKVDTVPEV